MPKLIDYPRTSYPGAWELAEIVDETGGKSSIENAAKKMDRKVSGSFKAIIGSAVKFGLITSKRELLSTTTLFKRIKHAYDKEEEMLFHKEAFLAPPLFTQLCRKFRNRELPVQMLDVMLMREFGVEEINAQGVAKVFVDGCRMCGILDDANIVADIDTILNSRTPKRSLANPLQAASTYQPTADNPIALALSGPNHPAFSSGEGPSALSLFAPTPADIPRLQKDLNPAAEPIAQDAVASLFDLPVDGTVADNKHSVSHNQSKSDPVDESKTASPNPTSSRAVSATTISPAPPTALGYQLSVSGPGVNTSLDLLEEADVEIALALLEKIRRRFRQG